MIKNKIITGILLIFSVNFAYSQETSKCPVVHSLRLDINLGYPTGVGLGYNCAPHKRVMFNVAKIQLLNFYNEDIFMQYMAGLEVKIAKRLYIGVRGGYWHLVSFPHGGFCLEPEFGFGIYRKFGMGITYNYLAYIDKGVYRGSVRAYPELKLKFTFRLNR